MNPLRLHLFLFFLFINILLVRAQNENSLLWQINGKNLSTPSYLYGTIHITDKRVFNFPDSVIAKIIECDAVAFELNFDSISEKIINNIVNNVKRKRISDLLSDNEVERLEKTLRKNNVPIDNIKLDSPLNIYQKFQKTLYKNNDMSTFLDAYIFGISRKYSKKIIGLETYEEHMNTMGDLKDEDQKRMLLSLADSAFNYNNYIDSLISLYLQERVNDIYRLVHQDNIGDFENILLTKRNYIMERRIDSLMKNQSMVVCVGAAHLSGDEGLISLLQKRGYTVVPVYSPRTGYYKKFIPEDSKNNWRTITDTDHGFKIKMPGDPTSINVSGIEMKGYIDMGTGYFYLATAFPSMVREKGSKKVMEETLSNLQNKFTVNSKKQIKYLGLQGLDIEAETKSVVRYSIRLLTDTGNLYMMMAGVANKKPEQEIVKVFFESFSPIKRVVHDEFTFSSDTGAFQIMVPFNFKLTEDFSEENVSYKTYACVDYSLQGLVSVTYIDYGPGYYFPDLNLLYETAFAPIKSALKTEPSLIADNSFKGYNCRDYKIIDSDKSILYIRYILRGARLYVISVTTKNPEKEKDVFSRMASFDFLPSSTHELKSYISEQKDFSILMNPGKIITTADSSDESVSYTYGSQDILNGNWFKIYSHTFSPYDYFKNDSSLIEFFKSYVASSTADSIVKIKTVQKEYGKVYDFDIATTKNPLITKKVRAIVNGQNFYFLIAVNDLVNSNDSLNSVFFNSFKPTVHDTLFDIFSAKTEILLESLNSNDTLIHQRALEKFRNYSFEKSDIPNLKSLVNKDNLPDDSTYRYNTRHWAYKHIYSLMDSIEKTSFIKASYSSMPDSGTIRLNALSELAYSTNPEALKLWKELILNKRPKPCYEYGVYECLGRMTYDSIPLIATLYPELSSLLDDTLYKTIYYSITSNALKRNIITTEAFSPHEDKIFNEALLEHKRMKEQAPYYSSTFNDVVFLLNALPYSDRVLRLNRDILSDSVTYDKIYSFLYLINNNVVIDKELIKKYMSVASHRNDLYEALQSANRLDAFPPKIKKQKLLAQGDLMRVAESEEFYGEIEFIEERKINFEGQLQRFFLFRILYDEEYSNLGIAGPYPLTDKDLVTRGSFTSINYKNFDKKNIETQFKELIDRE